MIVCHCKAISDREVRAAVRAGARSCRQVARACEAGGSCGGCRPLIHEIIHGEGQAPARVAPRELAVAAS